MNRKKLVSSILTIVLCLSLIAGTTYALFTSEDNVNIAVNSGKVDVNATILDDEMVTSSLGEKQEAGKFANGGTALFTAEKVLKLTNVTPGDKVEFAIQLTNESTVEIQYRLTWVAEGELSKHLVITSDGALTTDWAAWKTTDAKVKVINVTVELPAEFETQDLTDAAISFTVEAVQANAIVEEVATADQLWTALEMGAESITLTQNITLDNDQVITVAEGVKTTINLAGNELIGSVHKSVGHVIKNNGTLTITGGTISSTADNGGSAVYNAQGATMTLENVKINGAPKSGSSWPSYAINNYGTLTINGADITSNHGALSLYGDTVINNANVTLNGIGGSSHVFYIGGEGTEVVVNDGNYVHNGNVDGSLAYIMTGTKMTVNGGTFSASNGGYGLATYTGELVVNGGTFANAFLDWGGPITISGGTFASKPADKHIAQYHAAYQNTDGTWTVDYAEGVDAATSTDDLKQAIADGNKTVILEKGTYDFPSNMSTDGLTIIGQEGVVFNDTLSGSLNNTTIKNVHIKAGNAQRWAYSNGTLLFENCTFEATSVYAIHYDGLNNANITYKNCKIIGWVAIGGGAEHVTFDGCEIYGNGSYGVIRLYSPGTIRNCTFDVSAVNTNDVYQDGIHAVDCTINLSNNTNVNGDMTEIYNISGTGKLVVDGQVYVATSNALADALAKGENITLVGDVSNNAPASNGYGKSGFSQTNGGVFDGNGNTLTVTGANGTWDSAFNTNGGTIKNLIIDSGFRGIFVTDSANAGKVYLENVTIDGPVYTISCDQGSGNGLEAKNSTFNGWTSYAATIGEVKFEGCNFGEGAGYAFCRPYAKTTFVNCNFEEGYLMDPRAEVTFENCYLNGVLITAENVDDLVYQNLDKVTVK